MQPYTIAPRTALTAAQVTKLIRDSPGLIVTAGAELLDRGLNLIEDITSVLVAGSVQRQSYADLHGSATLTFERELEWGSAIVRPFMVLANGGKLSARFNLGAYYTTTPNIELGQLPLIYETECIDVLDGLNDPVGDVFSVGAGTAYLTAVEQILLSRGYPPTAYGIDQTAAAAVLPSAQAWALDDTTTWLNIINQLLGAIGYQGVWSDWDGRLRVQPYVSPSARVAEWTYDVELTTSMLSSSRRIERDWYRVPNRWIFYRQNNVDGATPVEGNGLYTVTNTSDGPTSIEARGGRVITRTMAIDAVDQASLVQSAQVTVDADLRLKSKVTLATAPNPLHWHFDRVRNTDPAIGSQQQALVTSWTLPLDGGDMAQEWSLL